MPIVTNPANWLVSAEQASGNGSAVDARAVPGLAYLYVATYASSALYTIQASHNLTAWMTVSANITATTTTATAQFSGYYPYLRANVNSIWSGGGNTGSGQLFWHPIA